MRRFGARAVVCLAPLLGACTPVGRGTTSTRPAVTVPVATDSAASPSPSAPALEPRGPAALSALPRGAALYGSLRWDQVESLFAAIASDPSARGSELEQLVNETPKGVFDFLRLIHADRERPILFAALVSSEQRARPVIDALVASGPGPASERAVRAARGEAILMRLIVPLSLGAAPPTTDFPPGLEGVFEKRRCESTGRCSAFSAQRPLWLAKAMLGARIAFYADGQELRLDAALPLFGGPDDPEPWQTLAEFAARRAGPEAPRCRVFNETAAGALCVDADRMAELGTAFAYSKMFYALQDPSFEPKMVRRIAEEGRKEALQNIALASPTRRLLDDGTLTLSAHDARLVNLASWSVTPTARARLEPALTDEHCGGAAELLASLLPAFGDAGSDFHDAKGTLQAVQEAGWTFWPIAFARSWPNVLIAEQGRLAGLERTPGRFCARLREGRLEVEGSR